ncbi:MAG TPA: S8 family serine peptidase [Blastocatellia bacterium]|nr:S8 family serine peptidase [Blastocatellia bacterium]
MTGSRAIALLSSLAVAAVMLAPLGALADDRGPEGEIVVTLKPGRSIESVVNRYDAELVEGIRGTNTYRLKSRRLSSTLRKLRKDSSVKKASPNGVVRRHQTAGFPNDDPEVIDPINEPNPRLVFTSQVDRDPLQALGIDLANTLADSGDEITVAVLDTGIDPAHESVVDNLWSNPDDPPNGIDDDNNGFVDDSYGCDLLDNDGDPNESAVSGAIVGHGTFIAGLIALAAPRTRVMSLRVLNGDGVGSAFDAAEAVDYAAQHGAKVISMSFGADGNTAPQVLRDAIASARSLGIVLVAAVGNDASQVVAYPASDTTNVISVGATDGDTRAEFSNYGDGVDVAAPGVALVSALPGTYPDGRSRYARWSGTSFATGLVAASCAVLLSTEAVADPDDIRDRLKNTGDNLPDNTLVGKRVNFYESVGSIYRDAGVLDVYSQAAMITPGESPYVGGFVQLRTIGAVERLTAYAWDLSPFTRYSLYVAPSDGSDAIAVGDVGTDFLGNAKLVSTSGAASNSSPHLPLPLDRISAVAFVDSAFQVVRGAIVDPESNGVQVWAGVGLRAIQPGDPDNLPFGRAYYAFDRGEAQAFDFVTCALEPLQTYALIVNGEEVARGQSYDEGSLEFWFSTVDDDVKNGATRLTPESVPALYPVTRARDLVLVKIETNGDTTPIMAGSFAGAEKRMPKHR